MVVLSLFSICVNLKKVLYPFYKKGDAQYACGPVAMCQWSSWTKVIIFTCVQARGASSCVGSNFYLLGRRSFYGRARPVRFNKENHIVTYILTLLPECSKVKIESILDPIVLFARLGSPRVRKVSWTGRVPVSMIEKKIRGCQVSFEGCCRVDLDPSGESQKFLFLTSLAACCVRNEWVASRMSV